MFMRSGHILVIFLSFATLEHETRMSNAEAKYRYHDKPMVPLVSDKQ